VGAGVGIAQGQHATGTDEGVQATGGAKRHGIGDGVPGPGEDAPPEAPCIVDPLG
jgi:hypothetical protein